MNNKTYTVRDAYNAIDAIAPFALAEKWDNVGLLVGSMSAPVKGILVALDITGQVLDEAIGLGASLIVAHHPVIFDALKVLDTAGLPYRLAVAGLSVISAHTNLDIAAGGVNDMLAERLGLLEPRPLHVTGRSSWRKIAVFVPPEHARAVTDAMAAAGAGRMGNYASCSFAASGEGAFLPLDGANPARGEINRLERLTEVKIEMLLPAPVTDSVVRAMKQAHPYEHPAFDLFENLAVYNENALGRVARLPATMTPEQLAAWIKQGLRAPGLKYLPGKQLIERLALCGGSGGDLLDDAYSTGAQAFLTAEVKHHQWLRAAELGLTLIDAGHAITERVIVEPLARQLANALPGCGVRPSGIISDGVLYL